MNIFSFKSITLQKIGPDASLALSFTFSAVQDKLGHSVKNNENFNQVIRHNVIIQHDLNAKILVLKFF